MLTLNSPPLVQPPTGKQRPTFPCPTSAASLQGMDVGVRVQQLQLLLGEEIHGVPCCALPSGLKRARAEHQSQAAEAALGCWESPTSVWSCLQAFRLLCTRSAVSPGAIGNALRAWAGRGRRDGGSAAPRGCVIAPEALDDVVMLGREDQLDGSKAAFS